MALIPNVAPGAPVAASWGNSIRDRTMQTFANETNLNAWKPADGVYAWNTANKRLYLRINSTWVKMAYSRGSNFGIRSNASGQFTITHGGRETPTWVQAIPADSTPNVGLLQVVSVGTLQFTLRAFNREGRFGPILYPNAQVNGYWSAGWN
jgi:hypothetical protein